MYCIYATIKYFLFLQILPAEEYTTSKRNGCVKLRKEDSGLGSEESISVPTLLTDAAEAYPDVSFLRTWHTAPPDDAFTCRTNSHDNLF